MTLPLFPAAPPVLIEPTLSKASLTKAQKQFNTLVKKIEALKAELAEWHEVVPRHSERLRREYEPLLATYNELRFELVQLLDRACTDKRVTKTERKKLRDLIPSITAELMAQQPSDAVKEIHDKYSGLGFDEQDEMVDEAVKSMMAEMFGIDLGDDVDINDPEQMREFMARRAREEQEKFKAHQQRVDERRAAKKKTARQVEQEARQQTEAVQVQKSLQEIFRRLVAALHPDRAPDEAERERRTGLMQRVNVAYEKKDLLQLLELQVQVEHIGKTNLRAQSDERLNHYNKILKEQCEALKDLLDEAQMPFRFQFGLSPYAALSSKMVVATMEQDIRAVQASIVDLQRDLRLFQDTKNIKAYLRDYKISKEPEFDALVDIFSASPFGMK